MSPIVRNEFFEQFAEAVRKTAPCDDDFVERLMDALYRSYWQGWEDGLKERRQIQPSGASGRGVIAALPAFRDSVGAPRAEGEPHP